MDGKKRQEVGQWVDDHAAELNWHQGSHAGKELLHQLCGVIRTRWNQVLPQLVLIQENFGTSRNPADRKMYIYIC